MSKMLNTITCTVLVFQLVNMIKKTEAQEQAIEVEQVSPLLSCESNEYISEDNSCI